MDNICATHCGRCLQRQCCLGCKMALCSDCNARFHACKLPDHLLLCPRQLVPCINAQHGCDRRLPREQLGGHLSTCPASIVECPLMVSREFLSGAAGSGRPTRDGFFRSHLDTAYCVSSLLQDRRAASASSSCNLHCNFAHRAASEPAEVTATGAAAAAAAAAASAESAQAGDSDLPSCGLSARILSCLQAPPASTGQPVSRQLVNHHLGFAAECARFYDWRPRGSRICRRVVRRDEFAWHAAQHQQLLPRLAGSDTVTAETVCPLAHLGCTARFSGDGRLAFDVLGHAFAKAPEPVLSVAAATGSGEGDNCCHGNRDKDADNDKASGYPCCRGDSATTIGLLHLPTELLDRILASLDSHALECLRSVSRCLYRLVDDLRLQRRRGCVAFTWSLRANQTPTGISGWRRCPAPSWFFSGQAAFASHDNGGTAAGAWLSAHLAQCQFYERSPEQTGEDRVRVIFR